LQKAADAKNVLACTEEKKMNVLEAVTNEYLRDDVPEMKVGDTVKVHIKIKEGNRERIQVFEGYILKMQNGGIGQTFTVRRIASGVGVEKTFPVHSPKIDHIDVVKHGFVRRAKLNFMRERTGKSAKMRAAKEE
jgi:large subunit ribosomal protein L19